MPKRQERRGALRRGEAVRWGGGRRRGEAAAWRGGGAAARKRSWSQASTRARHAARSSPTPLATTSARVPAPGRAPAAVNSGGARPWQRASGDNPGAPAARA